MLRFFASTGMKRSALAAGLCLLAVLFAVEAKTAWYGPANGPGVHIQSQKALPADLPVVVSHGVSTHTSQFLFTLLLVASVAAIARPGADFLGRIDLDFNYISVSSAPYFSHGLFFRPPPAL
jgi:hypothetical protein